MYDYGNDKKFQEGYLLYKIKHNLRDDSKLSDYKVKYQLDVLRELGKNNRMRYKCSNECKTEVG